MPIYLQVQEIEQTWANLWWEMAGGVASDYEKLKATDVFEFWILYDLWEKDLIKQTEFEKAKAAAHTRKR